MNTDARVYVAGHTGLLGSAILWRLLTEGFSQIITRSRVELDLGDQESVRLFFDRERPDYVFLAAAKVGSVAENIKYPLDFMSENLKMQQNVIENSFNFGVKKLIFFGANCMYPRECAQPIKEEYLYSGPLEPTNRPYAVAKFAGLELCRGYNVQYGANFLVAVPASMYGENDHFGLSRAHVIPDMLHKLHKAKENGLEEIIFWGDGSPLREFIFADDAADAAIFLMKNSFSVTDDKARAFVNIGTGEEISIFNLALLISEVVGYSGKINWDASKPNGMPRKLLDSGRINSMGWRHKVGLRDGIEKTYQWYLGNFKSDL